MPRIRGFHPGRNYARALRFNYRGISLYFGRWHEIFLTHQLYGKGRKRGERNERETRGEGWTGRECGVRRIRASRISFSFLRLSFLGHVRNETVRVPLIIKETEF